MDCVAHHRVLYDEDDDVGCEVYCCDIEGCADVSAACELCQHVKGRGNGDGGLDVGQGEHFEDFAVNEFSEGDFGFFVEFFHAKNYGGVELCEKQDECVSC